MRVAVGSDHAGLTLRRAIAAHLERLGHDVEDVGTETSESVDYPDFAAKVARTVVSRSVDVGILICGTGVGMSIAANKIDGVRAALCTSEYCARMAREHNDANVLCLGARVVGEDAALALVDAFLAASFAGGRHARRVQKIADLETQS